MLKNNLLSMCYALLLLLVTTDAMAIADGAQQDTLTVKLKQSQSSISFNVTLPSSYQQQPSKQYVVLFDFHPRSHAYLAGMHDWMSHNSGWPWLETIIVTAPDGNETLGNMKKAAIEVEGDTQLLDFMQQQLLPAISSKYRSNGFNIFSGFTGNAGLGLYMLINRPELFNAYFIASPVLSQDFAYVLQDAPKKLAAMKGKSRFLLMSTSDSGYEQGQLASFAQMEAILKTHATDRLDYRIKRFDGTYYMTQPVLATAYGIELLFDDYHTPLAPTSGVAMQGAQAIVDYYQQLSTQKYGFEVSPVSSLIKLAQLQTEQDPQQGLQTYLFAVKQSPQSATAHDAIAAAYGELKQYDMAIKHQQLALDNTQHPFWIKHYTDSIEQFSQLQRGDD
ncbi:alpha/beta hydrolase-fold protein [Shewanella sp. Scap07]|uniref:alpha/beta hydrolase-fold protein n=1 Tax=Shewanella sp. Scap07 TaxID=2589987 RepID=UPI002117AC44|nr:alpha/beta hydrolase-fold protein [Shewanella sp. Scap07]